MNVYEQIDHACNMHAELGARCSRGRMSEIQSQQEIADWSRARLIKNVQRIVRSKRYLMVAVVFSIFVGLMNIATSAHAAVSPCSWDHPGANRYTGTPEAAIMAMKGIPSDVKAKLIDRAQRNDYDDTIQIGRDRISGGHAYRAEIGSMAFGSHGGSCTNPSRAGWKPDHTESALVFCEAGFCIARPAICNNWSMVYREQSRAQSKQPAGAAIVSGGGGMVGAIAETAPVAALSSAAFDPVASATGSDRSFALAAGGVQSIGGFGGGGFSGGGIGFVVNNTPVAAVPEPESYVMILTGLVLIAIIRRRRKCM